MKISYCNLTQALDELIDSVLKPNPTCERALEKCSKQLDDQYGKGVVSLSIVPGKPNTTLTVDVNLSTGSSSLLTYVETHVHGDYAMR